MFKLGKLMLGMNSQEITKTNIINKNRIVILAISFLLSGCASIVYKDAASSYVSATKELVTQLNEVSSRLAKADDNLKLTKSSTDQDCPIADERRFVRAGSDVRFSSFLKRFPALKNSKACNALTRCEIDTNNRRPNYCQRACYSADEANCLVQIEQNYILLEKNGSAGLEANGSFSAKEIALEANSLATNLGRIEYKRSGSFANKLAADNLRILSEYMDMLEKATSENKADLTEDAKRLSDKMVKLTEQYTTFTGKKLSSNDQKSRDNIKAYLGAFGKLAGDLQVLAANAKDAQKIKLFVKQNAINVEEVINGIKPIISGDDLLGLTLNNIAYFNIRKDIQNRYQREADPYARMLLINEIDKFQYANSNKTGAELNTVFDKVSKSHEALVSLVINPTDTQLRAIREEEFKQLKAVAEDVASVLTLVI